MLGYNRYPFPRCRWGIEWVKNFRYKAFERIFRQSEDSEEVVNRVENKINIATRPLRKKLCTNCGGVPLTAKRNTKKSGRKTRCGETVRWLDQISITIWTDMVFVRMSLRNHQPLGLQQEMFYIWYRSYWDYDLYHVGIQNGQESLNLVYCPLDVTFRVLYAWCYNQTRETSLLESSQLVEKFGWMKNQKQ